MNEKLPSKSSPGSPKMQQIERYGVIALVFLLVTIVAVSFWGDSKSPGFWSRLTGKTEAKKDVAQLAVAPDSFVVDNAKDANLPITTPLEQPLPPIGGGNPVLDGNVATIADNPLNGNGTLGGPNPFAPPMNEPIAGPIVPVPTPAPAPAPAPLSGSEYTIQKGDSLAGIAKRKLGSEGRWTEIQSANPGLDPKRLRVGSTIRLPSGTANSIAAAPKPVTAPVKSVAKAAPVKTSSTHSYTIKKGDVLSAIARTQLGDERRWKEIVAVNPGLDPAKLAIGTSIKLPGGAKSTPARTSPATSNTSTAVATAIDNKPRVK